MTKKGWCWDCKKDVAQKVMIPVCAKNPQGLAGIEHGNDGSCTHEYCRISSFPELEWDGKTPLEKYEDTMYRCPTCDTLNVEGNGHGRPHPCTRHKHHPKDGPCGRLSQIPKGV